MSAITRFLQTGPVSPRVRGTLDDALAATLLAGLVATLLTRFVSDR